MTGNLSLKWKTGVTLALALATLLSVFLMLLLPFERQQHRRLLEREQRLLATLREKYERDIIYDILSETEEPLALTLAALCREPGIVWARLDRDSRPLLVTADEALVQALIPPEAPPILVSTDQAVLLVRDDGTMARIGTAGGMTAVAGAVGRERWPAIETASPRSLLFEEGRWRGRAVLRHWAELRAAEQRFGRLEIVSSLADVQRGEQVTRGLLYSLVVTTFVLLLIALNLLMNRIVIAPVQRVLAAMDAAGRGRLDVRLAAGSGDEVGRMAHAFNAMVGELEASRRAIEEHSRNLERTVAERTRELREMKDRLETVIANVGTGVISLDGDARITTFNEQAARILGIPPARARGRPLDEVLRETHATRLADEIAPVREGQVGVRKAQVALRLPSGARTLSVGASALGSGPRERGLVIVIDDLTDILASQRLEAWKQAVEKVIHEIKNPLTPIAISAQALQRAYESDRQHFEEILPQATAMIIRSVQQLKELISEFTRFYRLPKVVLRPHDLNRMVEDALSVYRQSPAEGIAIRTDLAPGLPLVEADPEPLKRVLANLINNGLEAMEGRGGELLVGTRPAEDEGYLVVFLRDEGVGVDDVDKIFEPYYTTKPKGTGLGLLISRQIVEEHGGEIRVQSELGKGTLVEVLLAVHPARKGRAA